MEASAGNDDGPCPCSWTESDSETRGCEAINTMEHQWNVVVIVVIIVIVAISIVIVTFLELLIVIVLATMVISLSYPRTTGHANVDTYGPRPCTCRVLAFRAIPAESIPSPRTPSNLSNQSNVRGFPWIQQYHHRRHRDHRHSRHHRHVVPVAIWCKHNHEISFRLHPVFSADWSERGDDKVPVDAQCRWLHLGYGPYTCE